MAHDNHGEAMTKCHELGLHPLNEPMGEDHHTDAPLSDEDKRIGDALAYFLGGLFIDVEERYFYQEMTAVDVWQRVARALRIHGLAITDRKLS